MRFMNVALTPEVNIALTCEDDEQTLETIRAFAKQLRRKKDPAGALTAGKIELAFSKVLEQVRQKRANPELLLEVGK